MTLQQPYVMQPCAWHQPELVASVVLLVVLGVLVTSVFRRPWSYS